MSSSSNNNNNNNYDSSLKGGFSTLVGGFGGYNGTQSSDTFSFDESGQIHPQIEFCLKRLLKKDSITKLKALQDLKKLFTTLSIDKLEASASAWAYTFNKLALVNDKRIRVHLHLCHSSFCKQISKHKCKWFEKHLHRIFFYWWIHLHDTASEVIDAAYNSFYCAFGKNTNKHWKVISYVKDSMLMEMQYILNINTTPQTLSNHIKKQSKKSKKSKKSKQKSKASNSNFKTSKEDIERYERVIASTLNSLATLIAKENEINNNNKNIFNNNKNYKQLLFNINNINLWRFINNSSPLLRNSSYLLCSSCLGNHALGEQILPLISSILFKCMSETYIPNIDNLWITLLGIVQYNNCWKYSKKKSFLIRLNNLIQIDIFTSCKYLRSFLLYIPNDYLFTSKPFCVL